MPFGSVGSASSCVSIRAVPSAALDISDYGYVMELGRIVMEDTAERLREAPDIKEFYLGLKNDGVRGRRRWKQRKTWR